MSFAFDVVVIVVTVVSIFKVIFEVVVLFDFGLDLNVDAAPIFLDCPNNFCNPEDILSFPMKSTAFLMKKLLRVMFSFWFPRAASEEDIEIVNRYRQSLSFSWRQ